MIFRATSALGGLAGRLAGGHSELGSSSPPTLTPRQEVADLLNPHRIAGQWRFPVEQLETIVLRAVQDIHQSSLQDHRTSKRRMRRYRSHRLLVRIPLRLARLKPRRVEEPISHDEAVAMYLYSFECCLLQFERQRETQPYSTQLETAVNHCRELVERLREHLPSSTHEST